jgi:hypothetical protein
MKAPYPSSRSKGAGFRVRALLGPKIGPKLRKTAHNWTYSRKPI